MVDEGTVLGGVEDLEEGVFGVALVALPYLLDLVQQDHRVV